MGTYVPRVSLKKIFDKVTNCIGKVLQEKRLKFSLWEQEFGLKLSKSQYLFTEGS